MKMRGLVRMLSTVIQQERGELGVLSLNRPDKLNALSIEMTEGLLDKIKVWNADDHPVKAILIKSNVPEKAFCVGGDVKQVVDCVRNKDVETPRKAFELNYKLDYFISKLNKPCLVLMDGMTFGGGCGLAMHARHKISTERTVWAMPETGIGYFPDCGSSFVFKEGIATGNFWGLVHAVSGIDVDPRKMHDYGLETHRISSQIWPKVERQISADARLLDGVLEGAESRGPNQSDEASLAIDRLFQRCCERVESVEEIKERFLSVSGKESSFTDDKTATDRLHDKVLSVISAMDRASPLAMKIAFELLQRTSESDSLEKCIKREWSLTDAFFELPNDFVAGVSSKIGKSSDQPNWLFKSLREVCPALFVGFEEL